MKNKLSVYLLLGLVIAAGGLLRSIDLGSESIWMDEAFALREAGNPDARSVVASIIAPPEGTPPLYFLFLHYWIGFFGTGDAALRAPSAIFSTLAILAIFFLGKEVKDEKTGLISAALLAFSMIHIVYSHEARPYGLFTLLLILSLFFFARIMKGKSGSVWYAAVSVLMLYTHYLSVFILAFQHVTYLLLKNRLTLRRWVALQAVIAVLFIPGLYIFFRQFSGLNETIRVSLGQKLGLPGFIASLGALNFLLPVLVGLVILFFLWKARIDIARIEIPERIVYWILLFAIAIGVLVHPDLLSSTFLTRYTHFFFPIIYVLAAVGISGMKPARRNFLAVCFIILAVMSVFAFHSSYPRKIQWKEAVAFMEGQSSEGEHVIVIGDAEHVIYNHYRSASPVSHRVDLHPDTEGNEEEFRALAAKIDGLDSFWVLHPEEYKSDGIYHDRFRESYSLIQVKEYNEITVYHYAKES